MRSEPTIRRGKVPHAGSFFFLHTTSTNLTAISMLEKEMQRKLTSSTTHNVRHDKELSVQRLAGLSEAPNAPKSTQRYNSPTKHHLLWNQSRKGCVFGTGQLTRSLLTRKTERSTRTHVGIIKKMAWQPKMFSSLRWWIRESLNT